MRERPVDSSVCPMWSSDFGSGLQRSLPQGHQQGQRSDPAQNPGCIDPSNVVLAIRRFGRRITATRALSVLHR